MLIDNRQFFPPGVSQEIEYVEDKNGRVHIIGVGLILYDNTLVRKQDKKIIIDMENNIEETKKTEMGLQN